MAAPPTALHKMGMTDIKPVPIQAGITQANGKSEKTECMGNIPIEICNRHGVKLHAAKIVDVNYVPQNKFNLFSLTKMIKQGWILHRNKECIWLTKDSMEISFDIAIQTAAGTLYCAYLKRVTNANEIAGAEVPTRMNINKAHDLLGHSDEQKVRDTAKALNWELTRGNLKVCQSCAAGKAKQKNVPKQSEHKPSTKNGERVFLDIATVKKPSGTNIRVSKPNWRILVDERTGLKVSDF